MRRSSVRKIMAVLDGSKAAPAGRLAAAVRELASGAG
jgi:hypothetical protein